MNKVNLSGVDLLLYCAFVEVSWYCCDYIPSLSPKSSLRGHGRKEIGILYRQGVISTSMLLFGEGRFMCFSSQLV